MKTVFKLCFVWLLATTFTVVNSHDPTRSTACGYEQLLEDLRNLLTQTQNSAQNCKSDQGMGAVVAQLVAELSSVKDNLNVLKISQQIVKSELQTTKSDLETTKSERQTTNSELQTMKSELQTTNSELQIMKSDLQTTQSKLQTMESEMQTTQSKLQTMELELQTTQSELQATKSELQATQSELHTTKSELQTMESELKTALTDLQSTKQTDVTPSRIKTDLGSTFIRWGRKSCPTNTTLVYAGVAGGKQYKERGSGTNRLCLTRTPQFDNTTKPPAYGYLYGAEYQDIPGHHDHDVPCSVCLAPQSTTIMVPATLTCPPGWTPHYTGHLASERYRNYGGEYVCLDGSPEDDSSVVQHDKGLLFYYTVTVCGSLPCPPYINDKVVTCVVCSK